MIDHLFVYLDNTEGESLLAGEVFFTARRGMLVSSTFHYNTAYLADPAAFPIDPALGLYAGPQNAAGLPGALRDSSPDRWGRNLVIKQRRAASLAEHRSAPTLTDVDFLVGVSDLTRQGALRFRAIPDGDFLGDVVDVDVPKLIELPRLLRAADAVSRDDDFAAIKALLDAGTGSLGGARPKASVRDGDRLLIAKFPHPDDQWDVMAWEKTTLDLAAAAGIRVPEATLTKVDGRSVLLLNRFDRHGPGRVPYMSAMTLLEARDGDSHDYTEIAETLPDVGSATTADLAELWRRIAFSVVVNNTDDHLRNHGFVHESGGWRLSPAFDMNPNPDPTAQRQTAIAGSYTRDDALASLREYASEFRLSSAASETILHEVTSAVTDWRDAAAANGIRGNEMALFADAFWLPTAGGVST